MLDVRGVNKHFVSSKGTTVALVTDDIADQVKKISGATPAVLNASWTVTLLTNGAYSIDRNHHAVVIGRDTRTAALRAAVLQFGGFDAVINMYSSFGYLETESDDLQVLLFDADGDGDLDIVACALASSLGIESARDVLAAVAEWFARIRGTGART